MDWREWLNEQLNDPAVSSLVGGRIFAAGSLKGAPKDKPFVTFRLGQTISELNDDGKPHVFRHEAIVFIHDVPGSYRRIDNLLNVVRSILVGQVSAESAIACTWQGDSGELSDEFYGTITRNASFRLIGRT